jgi:hypothetical protein
VRNLRIRLAERVLQVLAIAIHAGEFCFQRRKLALFLLASLLKFRTLPDEALHFLLHQICTGFVTTR